MLTKVVNRYKEPCDIVIGRSHEDHHFGNPFSVGTSSIAKLQMPTRYEAINAFHEWLTGTNYQGIEQSRRAWVLENLETLRGKTLGCTCKPKNCHGDVYRVLLGELTKEEALGEPEPVQQGLGF